MKLVRSMWIGVHIANCSDYPSLCPFIVAERSMTNCCPFVHLYAILTLNIRYIFTSTLKTFVPPGILQKGDGSRDDLSDMGPFVVAAMGRGTRRDFQCESTRCTGYVSFLCRKLSNCNELKKNRSVSSIWRPLWPPFDPFPYRLLTSPQSQNLLPEPSW